MSDMITMRITATMRPETYRTTADVIVVREDGSVAVIPKGTLLTVPVPDGPLQVERIEG